MVRGSITALEQEDRNLPGWPRYQADKWSFGSDLGGTTEYNFRPLGTEVFLLYERTFPKAVPKQRVRYFMEERKIL